jgi:glycosyltransferase involved in cell wall biosynthesis
MEELDIEAVAVVRKGSEILRFAPTARTVSYSRLQQLCLPGKAPGALRRLLDEQTPGAIILHKPRDARTFRLLTKDRGIPILLFVHAFHVKYLEFADHLIAVSSAVYEHLTRLGYKNVFLLNNFTERGPEVSVPWHDPVRIASFGYYRKSKGFVDWFKCLRMLHGSGLSFEAHVYGQSKWRPRNSAPILRFLKYSYSLKNLEMHRWTYNPREIMRNTDIVVIPSRSETFGMVAIEAMMEGCLVVATRCRGPETIIEHGKDGLLVEKQNPRAMHDAIYTVIKNREQFSIVRENGKKKAEELYSFEYAKEVLKDILNKI